MRLVDIDNLELQEYEPQNDLAYAAGWNDCVDTIKADIRDMPTIDAIPVEWMNDRIYDMKRAPLYRRYAEMLLMEWLQEQKEQEAQK